MTAHTARILELAYPSLTFSDLLSHSPLTVVQVTAVAGVAFHFQLTCFVEWPAGDLQISVKTVSSEPWIIIIKDDYFILSSTKETSQGINISYKQTLGLKFNSSTFKFISCVVDTCSSYFDQEMSLHTFISSICGVWTSHKIYVYLKIYSCPSVP